MNAKFIENKNNYGYVVFEGVEYALTCDADYSDRFLTYMPNYSEVSEGEFYYFEMIAKAVDEQGEEYEVSWIFKDVKGEEKDLDCYDYGDVCSVNPL